jgi:carbon-monoxide dehydrogenase medium subunit
MSPQHIVTKRLRGFRYYTPATVAEAGLILKESEGRGKILAGGTDLLGLMKLRAVDPEDIVSLGKIKGLDYIRQEGKELKIGAMTRMSVILESSVVKEKCLSLHEAAAVFATPQVRNMATIGGNICRSSPSADTVPPLMSFEAELRLTGAKGERRVLLEDFFTGAGQNLLDDEVLAEIVVPLAEGRYGTAFNKLTRNSVDLAKVNCAVKVTVDGGKCVDIKIVLGAVADRPVRAKKAEQFLEGRDLKDGIIEEAVQKIVEDIAPITDSRSTAEYRAQVSQVLSRRMIKQAVSRIN